MPGETYHFATNEPFLALCGQRTTVERNGHALTSKTDWVTCQKCLQMAKHCTRIRSGPSNGLFRRSENEPV